MTDTTGETEVRPAYVPDILDVIAALSSDAVPTPPVLARALLDLLPDEVWSNPDYKWLDPATKSGSILREVARRLMDGLAEWEPNPDKRADHILRNMLYGCGITQVHAEMSRRSVYVSRDASGPHSVVRFDDDEGNIPFIVAEHEFPINKSGKVTGLCLQCRAPQQLERGVSRENYAYSFIHNAYPTKEMSSMQFDVIVGNPPYQVGIVNERDSPDANPIYQYFVQRAIGLNPKYLAMIIPSRWFTGGKAQLETFRTQMIADRHIAKMVDNPKLFDCFPGVEIKGGVCYFLWDRDHDGDCEFSTRIDGEVLSTAARDLRDGDGVVVRDNNAMSIIGKVRKHQTQVLENVVSPRYPFGPHLMSNFAGAVAETADGLIPLVFVGHVAYIPRDEVTRNQGWIDKWKVLIPKAGDGHGREVSYVLGEPLALAPGSVCTQSYLVAGTFETRDEALHYAQYLSTKFLRFLVLQRKTTQDVTPDRFRFVPMLDMTREWTDQDLYKHFGLTDDEIDYIESTIHPRDVILSLDSPVPASHLPGGSKYRPPSEWSQAESENPEDDE